MGAETYIDRSQLESNIRSQKIPYKLLRDALSILETYDKYIIIFNEKKEDWTKLVDEHFSLSLNAFDRPPLEIKRALNFLQWIPLKDKYGEACYEKRKLTLEGFFIGIRIDQTDGPSPYSEESISGLWTYIQKDEVKCFLKEYLNNNKEEFSDNINKITLKINKNKMEVSKDNSLCVCPFRKNSKNRRFEYILILAKSRTKIGASKLSNKSIQSTSSEIDKINERLKKDLDLTENIIVNNQNSGYEINRNIYEVIFS